MERKDKSSLSLFVCGRDEEGVHPGVFVVSDLDNEFWDAEPYVVQKPEQRVVICGVCTETIINTS